MFFQMALVHSFLWLNNIPLCICATVLLSCSSVEVYLGGFHVLAIVNSAAMNLGVHAIFQMMVSPKYILRVGTTDHMVTLFLVFKGDSVLFSTVAVPMYIRTDSVKGFPFFHTLSSICYLQTF